MLAGEHAIFSKHSPKIPLIKNVHETLTGIGMPPYRVSVKKIEGSRNLLLRVCLEKAPKGEPWELPKAVEAIGTILKDHKIDHIHNGWTSKRA
jgi:hypothetical protein